MSLSHPEHDAPGGAAVVKDRVKQQFDQRAAAYDSDQEYHPTLARTLLQLCQPQPGQRVLDLACGTGLVALPAAAAVGPCGRVVGVDLSPGMLQQATAKAAALGAVSATTTFVCGDVERLQDCLPGEMQGSFDAAFCSAAIPFLTQPQQTLSSWRQWLKPGGTLAFHAFQPPALGGYEVFLEIAQQRFGWKEQDPSAALGSQARVEAALQAAGYSNIQVLPKVQERWVPADSAAAYAEKVWQLAINSNPFRAPEDLQAGLGEERLAAFHEAFLSAVCSRVVESGAFDAVGQRVRTAPVVLYVAATA